MSVLSTSRHAWYSRHCGYLADFPSNLMVDHGSPQDLRESIAPVDRRFARELIRLLQCPSCSRPFSSPVTLPCGHTICQPCLPLPEQRTDISYPNTPDRQFGITCPVSACRTEHATGECSVDVTFTNLMDLFKAEVKQHHSESEAYPFPAEDTAHWNGEELQNLNLEDESLNSLPPPSEVFDGSLLISTFTMAEMGALPYDSEPVYRFETSAADGHSRLDAVLLDRLKETAQKELDCQVCYNLMLDPTTTGCGHTFCRRCLARVMDHSNLCPLCRKPLHIPASLLTQPSNACLVSLLHTLCPDLVAARSAALASEERAGDEVFDTPLFVCTLALPCMPTFLHIFEPRYRLMMRRCLAGNRQFGMLMSNRSLSPQGNLGVTGFKEYGTLLEIVNYEILRDGRSIVETRGISRFRVLAHGMLDGYHVGRVEKVEDVSLAEEERQEAAETRAAIAFAQEARTRGQEFPVHVAANSLSTCQLLDHCMDFIERTRRRSAPWLSGRAVEIYGRPPSDPAVFPYWFASVLPIDEEEKYVFLQTTRVRERLKIVVGWIQRIEGQRWASGGSCTML